MKLIYAAIAAMFATSASATDCGQREEVVNALRKNGLTPKIALASPEGYVSEVWVHPSEGYWVQFTGDGVIACLVNTGVMFFDGKDGDPA